jgi:fatty acid desaturase
MLAATLDDDAGAGARSPASPAEIRALSRLRPLRTIAQIALEWALLLASIWACHRFFSWPLYLLTVIWVGARQHAITVLMHEATHYRLSPDKRVNDLVGNVTTAWPLFLDVASFRDKHFAHHRKVNLPEDPDWVSAQGLFEYKVPKRPWEMALIFLGTLLGFGAYRQIQALFFYGGAPSRPGRLPLAQIGFHAAVFTALALSRALPLYLAYWVVPLLTWMRWAVYLRFLSEHELDARGDVVAMTNTVLPSIVGRLFIGPNNIHYHIEHHLHPSVPFYNLPSLHRILMRDPAHRARARVLDGYPAVLRAACAREEAAR